MPMLSPSQGVHWIQTVLWGNKNKVLLLVLVTLEPWHVWLLESSPSNVDCSGQSYHKVHVLLPPVGSWTSCVHLLDFLCTLLWRSEFGAVGACYSLITAKSGNVWWEVLRGMVLSFQRPASLWLAENVAPCSCWDLFRWKKKDVTTDEFHLMCEIQ